MLDFWTIRTLKAGAVLGLPSILAACALISPDVEQPVATEAESDEALMEVADTVEDADPWLEPFSISVTIPAEDLPPLCYQYDAPRDLLVRIRSGFALSSSDQDSVRRHVKQYAGHPRYLNRVFTRSQRYLHHIVEELDRRELPLELALLPIVESAFDPFAYSHGRAAGLWQFIPSTARVYDLKLNWWYDGRRDVTASTRAALDYLERLHARYDGDWLLAVAAYNSGEGNVDRAIRRNTRANKPADFWHLRLPRETEAYVPKLLAIRQIVDDPGGFGLTLPRLADVPYFAEVETGGQIDLALAAELADTSIEEIYALNPGFNRWATDPDGPHSLLVPLAGRSAFQEALQGLPQSQRMQWTRYRINKGDSLSLIAKRHGTTSDVLRKINGLSGNTIRAGHHLMIPKAAKHPASYTLSADARHQRTVDRKRGESKEVYVVKPGDNLWEIGRAYGVSARQLAAWNGMAPLDTLSIGTELVVWGVRSNQGSPPNKTRRIHYTVRRGDSLHKISSKFKVSVRQLKRWNSELSRQKYLQPGQRLVMYVDITRQSG